MGLLIFAIVVILLVALGVYAVRLLPIPSPFNPILQALVVLIGIVAIAGRAGIF